MKFNLKNRPKPEYDCSGVKTEAWFSGFEKELREFLPESRLQPYCIAYLLLKEILGEEV